MIPVVLFFNNTKTEKWLKFKYIYIEIHIHMFIIHTNILQVHILHIGRK